MNRDDIIRMARDSEMFYQPQSGYIAGLDRLERFAALVVAAERNRRWTQSHWTEYELSIVAAEREACAQVCIETGATKGNSDAAFDMADHCAAAIRARGEK